MPCAALAVVATAAGVPIVAAAINPAHRYNIVLIRARILHGCTLSAARRPSNLPGAHPRTTVKVETAGEIGAGQLRVITETMALLPPISVPEPAAAVVSASTAEMVERVEDLLDVDVALEVLARLDDNELSKIRRGQPGDADRLEAAMVALGTNRTRRAARR